MIQLGGLGYCGLNLPELLRSETESSLSPGGIRAKADACILIYLNGGPSHIDMWDMKPDAPEGIRGEFKPIATSVPGVNVCEHLPKLATRMQHFSLVRSLHHTVNNSHAAAVYTSITGHDRGDATILLGGSERDYPTPGSVLGMLRPPERLVVANVVLPYQTKEGAKGPPQPGFWGGLLGRGHDPLFILNDPNAAGFGVPELTPTEDISLDRMAARRALLTSIGARLPSEVRAGPEAVDAFRSRALDLLTSQAARHAIDLQSEKPAVRDAYGRNIYGQSVLLARRLVEAGTRMVTISWAPDANATWDTHGSNFRKLRETLLPQFDSACSTLVDELVERGMWDRTIVAVLGDFGRTPRVNNKDGGRDHWNYCYTVMLGGGGFRGGFVYGASDKTGAFPARDALGPGDITASMYQLLGLSPDRLLHDPHGRPHRLVAAGNPIPQLFA
ncbi:MAG: DUF1501 domain-containing protein [Planctomycetia bacterium]|nr:DUF1501 domain-containing protein [Planctomycetia bacterium]